MLLNWLSSSTAEYISLVSGPCGSSMDSALSRTMSISIEDRNGRRGARFSGFSMLAPTTSESRRRKCMSETGNWSQRMNRRLFPNRCLMRLSWRTVRTTDVLPIPPAPIRAIGVRCAAKPTTSSISLSRPKILGGGGGDSPGELKGHEAMNPSRNKTYRPVLSLGGGHYLFVE